MKPVEVYGEMLLPPPPMGSPVGTAQQASKQVVQGGEMATRFRKSFKLAPGVKMNLSGGGISWTLGPRGASIGIGKRGTFLNAGIPGSGLSTRFALSGNGSSASRPATRSVGRASPAIKTVNVSLTVGVGDDGVVTFQDENGSPASDALVAAAKKQQGPAIMAQIQAKCDEINGQVAGLGQLHLDTPLPTQKPQYVAASFDIERPKRAAPKVPGFIDQLFKSRRKKIEAENVAAEARYQVACEQWDADKQLFESAEHRKEKLVRQAVAGDPQVMEEFFGEALMDIVWPRETLVSFEVRGNGKGLAFDVDLPEFEDMPTKTASVPQRGYRLSVKEMGQTAVQRLYAEHVHSIAFRLIGEAFGLLPTVQEVSLSGYSQRVDKRTGHVVDQYLLSVVVSRAPWQETNFRALKELDVVEALGRFQLRREMSRSFLFKPVEPF
ncbi:hypothetical protein J2W49_002541 [Hydrogenophaga palleronii]|uniref:DUF4236 domain-containing protein n=1 Tax=Hydrogenophaga palleronii TaxID=65655 RepID=A0ABU1WMS3_9BURK|nr:DUF4236 domain-containing protein [Hydrogenophaga palleronii]MDR7150583.1 hypothetical protein [Hydrogenophaga palleronii]